MTFGLIYLGVFVILIWAFLLTSNLGAGYRYKYWPVSAPGIIIFKIRKHWQRYKSIIFITWDFDLKPSYVQALEQYFEGPGASRCGDVKYVKCECHIRLYYIKHVFHINESYLQLEDALARVPEGL